MVYHNIIGENCPCYAPSGGTADGDKNDPNQIGGVAR